MHSLGFSAWYPTVMAATIYGGSIEFVVANFLTQAFNPVSVLLICLVLSFRQFFYGIPMLSKYDLTKPYKWLLIFGLTDETFAVNYNLETDDQATYLLGSLFNYCYWIGGAWLGATLGTVANLEIPGIDFLMTALFIVLAIEQFLKEPRPHVASWSGLLITVGCLGVFGSQYFLIPALGLLTVEYLCLDWRQRR